MMGVITPSRLSADFGEESKEKVRNTCEWIEEEINRAKISQDKNTMNSIINKFGEVLREQQSKIVELEKELKISEEKKIQFA